MPHDKVASTDGGGVLAPTYNGDARPRKRVEEIRQQRLGGARLVIDSARRGAVGPGWAQWLRKDDYAAADRRFRPRDQRTGRSRRSSAGWHSAVETKCRLGVSA